ncbi:serine hydrolase [Parvibacter caecicola]|uniref:Glucan-binding YG repeat protein n=1 Tax=Parvibacter caecicola TaxID=747645 RepID=A0A7W5D1N8_9ACTN|nr:serine hydrolase [Parvibacter caecicola]MBB3171248.1 glucan-binding YG repeat protein [Parvibacter caecicola]MCR2041962.1 hypothetical protein [Parvibacter caecicola]
MAKSSCALGRAALAVVLVLSMVPSAALAQGVSGTAESGNGGGSAESPLLSDAGESSADESPRTIEAVLRLCDEQGDLAGLVKAEWLCGWVADNCAYDAEAEAADVEAVLEFGRGDLEDCAALCKELLEAAGFEPEFDADGDLTLSIDGQLYLVRVSLEDENAGVEQQEDCAFSISLEEAPDAPRVEAPAEVEDAVAPPQLDGTANFSAAPNPEPAAVPERAVPGLSAYGSSYHYGKSDGSYATNEWVSVGGKRYYFDANGRAAKWETWIDGSLYYFNGKCQMVTGWVTWKADGTKSYFGSDGKARSGFQKQGSSTYYMSPKTFKSVKWEQRINGNLYYFNGKCQMVTGWVTWKADGTKSYFGGNGKALTGLQKISGSTYYFDPKTAKSQKWEQRINGNLYYFNGKCQMVTGWVTWKADGTKSYFGGNGKAFKGLQRVGGTTYYFDPKTCKSKKWEQWINGKLYYFNGKGQMVTGWVTWNNDKSKSYFDGSGRALVGWQKLGGRTYYFNPSTARSVKWEQKINGAAYYFDGNGRMHTGWLQWNADKKWSYFNSNGKMATGTQTIDGVKCSFDANGKVAARPLNKQGLIRAIDAVSGSSSVSTFGTVKGSSAALQKVREAVNAITATGKPVEFVMIDISTGSGISYQANRTEWIASCVKSPYVVGVARTRPGAVSALKSTIQSCIVPSENEPYWSLRAKYGAGPLMSQGSYCGSRFDTTAPYPHVSPKELAKIWAGNYDYFFVNTNSQSSWIRNLFTKTQMSFIRNALGGKYATYTKPGWMTRGEVYPETYNDAGIVVADGRPYLVAVMSKGYYQAAKLQSLVRAIDSYHASMF